MSIRLLADEVASQIAAGEVVERPASVVKELIENAIDSKSNHIVVRVEEGGQRLVEVVDNGLGVPAEELPLAVTRHATSKLTKVEDLFNIQTLGFRGEALASIGSVSRMAITSRTVESQVGAQLIVDGGKVISTTPSGSPVGTQVRVENLFYNVPARLKFLKNPATERRIIDTLVARYALAYPEIRFQLSQEGKPSLQTSGNGDRREVLGVLFGTEVARQMLEVLAVEEPYQISGFISPISLTRSNRRDIYFFINRRSVQDISLVSAFTQAYHTMIMVGRYPLGVIFIDLPPELVDVNVHPTKAEVRFRQPDVLFSAVQRSVRRALLAHTPVPQIDKSPYLRGADWESAPESSEFQWNFGSRDRLRAQVEAMNPAESAPQPVQPSLSPPALHMPLLRLVGQVASAFIVAEGPDGLYLIDQHAAHERVLFEKFIADMAQAGQEHLPAQTLLSPVSVEMPPSKSRLLEGQIPVISRLGFQVEEFGANTYLVRAVPALLSGMDPAAALYVLVEDFEEDETPLQAEVEARIIARVCKRAAVKAGKTLSVEEQRALLSDLEACRSPRTCPHGRPTMIHLSVDLLERQFGRKGA